MKNFLPKTPASEWTSTSRRRLAAADGTFPRLHLQEPGRFPDRLPPRRLPFHHPLALTHVHELHDGPGSRV